jgi:hypothetical protein
VLTRTGLSGTADSLVITPFLHLFRRVNLRMRMPPAKRLTNHVTRVKSHERNAPFNKYMWIKGGVMRFQQALCYLSLIFFCHANTVLAEDIDGVDEKSFHVGLMHPNGVDVAGYSVEKKLSNNTYSFYNFGLPSLAAIGFTYYEEYKGNGFTATAGIGIGFVMYGSVAYQWKIEQQNYLKFGAGLATGYEHRFDK